MEILIHNHKQRLYLNNTAIYVVVAVGAHESKTIVAVVYRNRILKIKIYFQYNNTILLVHSQKNRVNLFRFHCFFGILFFLTKRREIRFTHSALV